MGSLTTCVRKAGAALNPEDKSAIFDAAAKNRKAGMKTDEAGRAAVRAQLETVQALIAAEVAVSGNATSQATAPTLRERAEAMAAKPKVYKTRAAAEAEKNGNTMRLRKVQGGYILRPATDKELQAAERAGRRLAVGGGVDVERDSLLVAIAKLGGLSMRERSDTIGEGNRNIGGKMLFRQDGRPLDDIARNALREYGYVPASEVASDGGVRWLRNAIKSEFMGSQQYWSEQGTDAIMRREQEEAFQAAQQEEESSLSDFDADDLQSSGYTAASPEIQALTESLIAEAEALGIDTEGIREDAAKATESATEDAYHAAVQEAIAQAIRQARGATGAGNAGAARGSGKDRGAADGEASQEGLTAPTPDVLRQADDRRQAAERADAAEQRRLADRQRADAERNEFVLTGSDRPADVGAAAGQGGLFDAPAEPAAASAARAESAARRVNPVTTIDFAKPIVGPTGARLKSYTWQWKPMEFVDARGEERVKRISDWDASESSGDTGREVVHQFVVDDGGNEKVVSAESALKILGFTAGSDGKAVFTSLSSSAKTLARLRMQEAELQQAKEQFERDNADVMAMPLPSMPTERDSKGWFNLGDASVRQIESGAMTEERRRSLIGAWRDNRMSERGWRTGSEDSLRVGLRETANRIKRQQAKVDRLVGEAASAAPPAQQAEPSATAPAEPPTLKQRADSMRKAPEGEAAPAAAPAAPGVVENFGEALPPARRNMAAKLTEDLTNDDIANRPFSEVWPLAENEAIEDPFAAAVAHAARAEVPAKPRVAYKLREWVKKVQMLRGVAGKIVGGTITRERIGQRIEREFPALRDWWTKVQLLESLPRDQWKRIGTVEERPKAISYAPGGQQVSNPTLRLEVDGKGKWLTGDPGVEGEARGTVAGNRKAITALLTAAEPEQRMEFSIYERRKDGSIFVAKKGDPEKRELMTFADANEARKAINEQYDSLVAAWEAVKARDNITERDLRSAENRPRVGKDYRKGRDITVDEFQAVFGFRGGEFGKWVQQGKGDKDRQALLNNTHDALMDLAAILNVPPRAMSLNGTLGIALGSRGSGWASAHFEPSNLVINLTKTRGAGTLAHEWFHALDNHFSRLRGGEVPFKGNQNEYRDNNYITHKPEPLMVHKAGRWPPMPRDKLEAYRAKSPQALYLAADNWMPDPKHPTGVRPEVEQRFADLVKTLNDSPMAKRAALLDKGGGYWSRTLELAARAFESHVIAKMHEQGYHNDFLVNVKKLEETGKADARYPYLLAGEVKPIADAFDALFSTVQTRPADEAGNIALFSRNPRYVGFVSPRALRTAIAEAIAGWNQDLAEVEVVNRVEDLPADIQQAVRNVGAENTVRGLAMPDGRVYLVAENISTIDEGRFVLFHEVYGHVGMRAFLGDNYGMHMALLRKANPALAKEADAWFKLYGEDEIAARVAAGFAPLKARQMVNALAVEEALADRAGSLPELKGWQRVLAALQRGLRRMGLGSVADMLEGMTEAETLDLLVQARRTVQRGQMERGLNIGRMPAYQRVWHGTPYRGIEQFSTDAIGTGEGAQAYGWGLYFAGKREVADYYRKKLAGDGSREFSKDGKTLESTADLMEAYYKPGRIVRGYRGADKVLEFQRTPNFGWTVKVVGVKANGEPIQSERPRWHSTQPDAATLKSVLEDDGWKASTPGQLYEVDIPEDSEMLLWDKPLSEQPGNAAAAVQSMSAPTTIQQVLAGKDIPALVKWVKAFDRNTMIDEMIDDNPDMTPDEVREAIIASYDDEDLADYLGSTGFDAKRTGESIYRELASKLGGDQQASQAMRAAGIRGIKYLDGTSRNAGDGTYNYVIFDGADAKIAGALFSRRTDQTQTPEFKRWFGDSKVVDSEGRPLVVYHGTRDDIAAFDGGRIKARFPNSEGFYFTSRPSHASAYADSINNAAEDFNPASKFIKPVAEGANVMPAYVSLQNPKIINVSEWGTLESSVDADGGARVRGARAAGHDGVIVKREADDDWSGVMVIAFRPEQIKSAIGNTGAFDPTNADIRFSRRTSQDILNAGGGAKKPAAEIPDWVQQGDDALKAAAAKIDTYAPRKTLGEKFAGLSDGWQEKLVQGMLDAYAPLKKLSMDAYIAARMTKASDGALEGMLLYGKPVMGQDGGISGEIDGKGFLGMMKELNGEHDRFFMWLAGNRAKRLMADGKEHLFTAAEIEAMGKLNTGTMPDGTSRMAAFKKAHDAFNAYGKSVLDVAEKAGLIDGEARALWENDFYVPFYRVSQQDNEISGPTKIKGLVRQKAFERLKGGKEPLGDLMENTLRNWSHLLSASLANVAAQKSLKAAEDTGIAFESTESAAREVAKATGLKGNVVYFMDQGKQRWYVVEDQAVLTAISALESPALNGLPLKVMHNFKKWLTFGVTISPAFKIRNLIRDTIAAPATNEMGYNVLSNLTQGWKTTGKGTDAYAQMLFSGGMTRFGTYFDGDKAENVKRLIKAGVKSETILNTPDKVADAFKRMWTAYQDFGDRMENVNRAALYQQLIDEGKSPREAAFLARDMIDFSLQGSWAGMRILNAVIPFLNARMQGLYKLGRGAKENPKRFGYVVGAVAMASIALMLAYEDDEDWKQREDWDRDGFWWFKIGETAYRIPKPFEVGALGTIAERSVELMVSDEMTGKRFAERIKEMFMSTFAMNPVPQAFKPLLDIYSNKDGFTGRPIETLGMERLSKPERAGANTSAIGKLFGAAGDYTDVSPVQVDYLIRSYFGWLGSMAALTSDIASAPFEDVAKPSRDWGTAVFGNFVKDVPEQQSRYLTDFYAQLRTTSEAMADLKAAREAGDMERAKEIMEERGDKVGLYRMSQRASKSIADINARIRRIRQDELLDADTKRERIDLLVESRNKIARQVMESSRQRLQVLQEQ